MTLDIKTVLIVLAVVFLWVLLSYGTYRLLATVPTKERDWILRTLTRRIFWVIFSPLLWSFVMLMVLDAFLFAGPRKVLKKWWKDTKPIREEKRRKRRERRQNFLFDPVRLTPRD